jgi:hypothetical protein
MTGALRIALAYFTALPLQRWTNGFGLALMVIALAIRVAGHGRATFDASLGLMTFGGLLLLMPLMAGGGMMRAASTRSILHLRPRGRLQMLLGATLAVTLIATSVTLVLVMALNPKGIVGVSAAPWSETPPLTVFASTWGVVAMVWLVGFIATGNRWLSALIGFVPLVLIRFGRTALGAMPDALVMVVLSVVVWIGFALWYLHAPSIRQWVYSKKRMEEAYDSPLARFSQWASGAYRNASRSRAMEQYLLGTPMGQVLGGVFFILVAALLQFAFSSFFSGNRELKVAQFMAPFLFLPVVYVSWGVLSFLQTRRARILWLRAGMDRMALFRQVERSGLRSAMLLFGFVMVAIVLHSLIRWPANTESIVAFSVVQIAFLICLFYGGLSLTGGWTVQDVLLCIGLCVLLGGEITLLQPWSGHPSSATPFVLVALLILAVLLRWHACRRWRGLDWRVARMPQFPLRA